MMTIRIVLGSLLTVVALAVAGRRVWWLFRLIRSGQPANNRLDDPADRAETEVVEVIGQRRLLKWRVPGLAHAFTFWGFIVLGLTIIEAWGALYNPDFAIPLIGRWAVLGFVEDFFAVGVLCGIVTFAIIRYKQAPGRKQRSSRFYGSHTRPAEVILVMIFGVISSLLLYRAAQINTGHFPFQDDGWAAFASKAISLPLKPLGHDTNLILETVFLLLNVAVILGFLVLVTYSKHLHIGAAPINVATKRRPDALGPLLPMESGGKPIDFEDPDEDAVFGRGKIEDFTWKGMLDFATCTECGRCQSQCPAWNTGKPLSPKLVIMDLRDHLFAKAPYLLGEKETPEAVPDFHDAIAAERHHSVAESGYPRILGSGPEQYHRPLVGTLEEGGVIDPDVLWSCTNCGACVEQCPVDIEHIDHIDDMRRYQVLIESNFPSEAGVMMRNLENRGNPWGVQPSVREDWIKELDFDVRMADGPLPYDVDYLFWVGCAGAIDDRGKRVTKAVAQLLHMADVDFAVLGSGETCSGDPARRMGNEFLFQQLAQENIETLNGVFEGRVPGTRTIVATCPHCFNSLGREYPQLGAQFEVIHHTQLLGRLVEEGRLTPVTPVDRKVTYHDPCFLGRHNKVYTPPREILGAVEGLATQEMHRCKDRGFCCGAGGARMWMEERIGKRINVERTEEALELEPDIISTACPYCITMLSDGLTSKQQSGEAPEHVEVLDVSQILLRSLAPVGAPGAEQGAHVGTKADDVAGTGSAGTEHGAQA
jgi:Fe-S oxidoreductase